MATLLLVVGALDVVAAGASVKGGALLTALIGGLLNLLLLLLLLMLLPLLLLEFPSNGAALVAVGFDVVAATAGVVAGGSGGVGVGVVVVVVVDAATGEEAVDAGFSIAGTSGFTSTAVDNSDKDNADEEVEDVVLPLPPPSAVPQPAAVESTAEAKELPAILLPTIVICTKALITCSLGCVSKWSERFIPACR